MDVFLTQIVPVLTIVVMLAAISIVWTGLRGAPWLPTPRAKVRKMLTMAKLRPGETLYDLGCGDGRVLVMAVRDFGAQAVGIEIDPLRALWSRGRITLLGLGGQARLVWGDFFKQDLGQADVVMVYLTQEANLDLLSKLWRELRPGSRVVSYRFLFPGWEMVAMDRKDRLYLYRIPELPWEAHRAEEKREGAGFE